MLSLFTNIPSPHQIPLGNALHAQLGPDFHIIFAKPIDVGRQKLGWSDSDGKEDWVIRSWESTDAQRKAKRLFLDSEVVIYGAYQSVSSALLAQRIRSGKITFRFSERIFKRGFLPGLVCWAGRLVRELWPLNKSNHHLLAAGAYCARDYHRVGLFKRRSWQWGYFTEVPSSAPAERIGQPIHLLWAGRMLDWKRVDLILKAARNLSSRFADMRIDLIGDGPERQHLQDLRKKYGLEDVVRFHPSVSPAEVRSAMRRSHIYIMPSNYREGWGAVINEAMSEGCCVVSSTGPGAAPALIRHGENGFLFPNGDLGGLCRILERLMEDSSGCAEVGKAAWKTMKGEWSPEVAASRLLGLSRFLLNKGPNPGCSSGPCSPASKIENTGASI